MEKTAQKNLHNVLQLICRPHTKIRQTKPEKLKKGVKIHALMLSAIYLRIIILIIIIVIILLYVTAITLKLSFFFLNQGFKVLNKCI